MYSAEGSGLERKEECSPRQQAENACCAVLASKEFQKLNILLYKLAHLKYMSRRMADYQLWSSEYSANSLYGDKEKVIQMCKAGLEQCGKDA